MDSNDVAPDPTGPSPSAPDEILPGLFLGAQLNAKSKHQLDELDIRAVLNCAAEIPNFWREEKSISTLHIDLADDETAGEAIVAAFPKCFSFLDRCLGSSEAEAFADDAEGTRFEEDGATFGGPKKVLVHCQAGISRSATILIAYLMTRKSMSLHEAFFFVKQRRPVAGPNIGFMKALQRFELDLRPDLRQTSLDIDHYYVLTLIDMGFSEEKAKDAVARAGSDFNLVVSLCLM